MEQRPQRYLVFSRSITAEVLADLSQAHVVPGLVFETQPDGRLEQSPVTDASGQVIGFLAWPSQLPGTASFEEVAPYLLGALTLLVALLGGFALLSRFIVIDIHRERIKAEYQATHDALSGLLNRNGMFNSLDRLIGEKTAESIPALVYLDLDGFKDVNDSYGHAVGDTLIRIVSSGLSAIASGDTLVSRLGGDEFALLLKSGPGCERTDEVATAIHDLFKEIIDIDGRSIIIGASIGIATAEDEDVDAAELVRRADLAMYSAKDRGRGRTAYYVPAMDADRTYKNLLETDLRNAIAADSLTVAYQPLVDARTSLWHGVEALARWRNERTGQVIGPDVFIPIAERSGLIEMLGLQILRKALEATKNWPDLKVSVNVSPAQFRNPAFPEQVRQLLRQTGADPNLLTLEITEGFFIRNPERARRIVTDIKAMGISISLDDFGSGCSSIGYLRQFEFDRLKIDRSLVTALDHEANASNVILATVALANAFNIPVTAEGIESEEQAAILRLTGCDEFQGYLFGKPMSADEVGQIIHGLPSMASFA
jgi:diguanylate cyclase (GGDEF)-like protein